MFTNLHGVVAACAVNEKLAVDVDGDMVYLHPAFAFAISATLMVGAIALATGSVFSGKEDKVACLKLRWVGEQNAHVPTLLRHARRGQPVHGG